MAAILQPAPKPIHAQITVTGAAGVATLIFDGTGPLPGSAQLWDLYIENLDATAANAVFIGFTPTVDVADGYSIPGSAGGATLNPFIDFEELPPATKVYANCTAAATRDLRLIAVPRY